MNDQQFLRRYDTWRQLSKSPHFVNEPYRTRRTAELFDRAREVGQPKTNIDLFR